MKLFYLAISTFLISTFGLSQLKENDPPIERCNTTLETVEKRKQLDPAYKRYVEEIERKIRTQFTQRSPDCSGGKIIIPVAVHYEAGVVPSGQEACMVSLAENQVALLNAEITGLDPQNSAYGPLESCFGTPIGDACVEFCLATLGHPTGYGLTEGLPAVTIGTVDFTNINPGSSAVPKDPNWAGYLNIFVGDLSGGLLGEAAGIPGDFSGEGVVVNDCQFGGTGATCPGASTSGSCGGIYNEGNTLIHEIGHYLGLFHIWGLTPSCASDDGIADTPNMSSNYGGYQACNDSDCPDLPSTCGSVDMYMNYMSYASDGCMYMFSSGQADRIYQVATAAGFTTAPPTQCAPPVAPIADFTFGSGDVCIDGCVSFMDNSQNVPTSWTWSFSVSSGDITIDKLNSSDQNPVVCVNSGSSGVITASLSVSNSAGSDGPVVKMVNVTVLAPSDPQCQTQPCTQFASGPFLDLSNANACLLDCPLVDLGEEVLENEAFALAGLKAGVEYTLEFCNGYTPANWQAVITIATYSGGTVGAVLDFTEGCSINFTPSTSGDYIAIVSGNDNCGGALNSTPNGFLTFTCNSSKCESVCGIPFTDDGGTLFNYLPNQDIDYVVCPDGTDKVRVVFSAINMPFNCSDRLEVYNGMSSAGTLLHQLCGTSAAGLPNGGVYESASTGACLTFRFVSNGVVNRPGWEAYITGFNDLCSSYTVFTGGSWSNGAPSLTTKAIIESNYDTAIHGEFDACDLEVREGALLMVRASHIVDVAGELMVCGDVHVETGGDLNLQDN